MKPRVLFISSNGVGMGHLTRLIAVARRLPESVDVGFLTMSQALAVVEQFGFTADYIPGQRDTLSSEADWNDWLARYVGLVLDEAPADIAVFDGNLVYPGLASALAAKSIPLIWIRRGMWRADQDTSASQASARQADLVIEPDDVASEFDTGAAERREGAVVVDPIRLLEHDEVLTRQESCRALGLDPGDRYVLIQLGAGNNYNFIDLAETVIGSLENLGVRPVIVEWLTAELGFDLWPGVTRIRAFPIGRYVRAFDFVISAAGYNSFNELVSSAVPSVLVPNLSRSMDDQAARASFADREGAAVHLDDQLMPKIPEVLESMLDAERRHMMAVNCRRIAKANGAWQAAGLIAAAAEERARR